MDAKPTRLTNPAKYTLPIMLCFYIFICSFLSFVIVLIIITCIVSY